MIKVRILVIVSAFLLASCTKEEVTQVKRTTIEQTVVNSNVLRVDTFETTLHRACPYCFYREYPDLEDGQQAFPVVYVKFDDEFMPLPITHYEGEEFVTLNYWTDSAGTLVFGENGSLNYPKTVDVEFIFIWQIVE